MKKLHKNQTLIAEINITPFTDVILVLLIIFIVATPLISQNSIEVKLPKASSKETIPNNSPAIITITGEGVVYFENKVIITKELRKKIDDSLKKDPNLKVVVAADQACRFQEVMRVIDLLKESGVNSVNIAIKPHE